MPTSFILINLMRQMSPSILLRVEHPPVQRLRFDPDLHTTLIVCAFSLPLGPWSRTYRADLDEVMDLSLGQVLGIRIGFKGHNCSEWSSIFSYIDLYLFITDIMQ